MVPKRGKSRGRRRRRRRVEKVPDRRRFDPEGEESPEEVTLKIEEVETLRLVDLEGLNQEEAAEKMDVSRKTLWNDLKSARRKVAEALSKGRRIKIEGGTFDIR